MKAVFSGSNKSPRRSYDWSDSLAYTKWKVRQWHLCLIKVSVCFSCPFLCISMVRQTNCNFPTDFLLYPVLCSYQESKLTTTSRMIFLAWTWNHLTRWHFHPVFFPQFLTICDNVLHNVTYSIGKRTNIDVSQ